MPAVEARQDITPAMQQIESTGFTVINCEPYESAFEAAVLKIGEKLGAHTIGVAILDGSGADNYMLRHTESITQPDDHMLSYFALGCLEAANRGGETRIYDARLAARTLRKQNPDVAGVKIGYHSTVYTGQRALHAIITHDPVYGEVMRYRSRVHTNTIANSELPEGTTEEEVYAAAEAALDSSLIHSHTWQPGELLLVNNRITLHDRAPYAGHRVMVRYRYDDPHHKNLQVPQS